MKILYVMTTASTMGFFREHIEMLLEDGHIVEYAANCTDSIPAYCDVLGLKKHHIPFSRSPFSRTNVAAAKKLKSLIETGEYDIVHTHTPNASIIARFMSKKMRKKGLKVFYTAHGFHFYKGAPLKNWLIYYSVEWLCAHWTDVLITINKEDYELAQKRLKAKKIEYVPGVGINLDKFDGVVVDRGAKRKELGIPQDATLLISVGELNENKNHETVIKAIANMDVYYIIAGVGERKEYLQNLIDAQGMTERIQLLGFRTDVKDLYAAADVFVFPSFREGLPVSLMEAMAMRLPCVASNIRGIVDLLDEQGGLLFNPRNVMECKTSITEVLSIDRRKLGTYNASKVRNFGKTNVLQNMKNIYRTNSAN